MSVMAKKFRTDGAKILRANVWLVGRSMHATDATDATVVCNNIIC